MIDLSPKSLESILEVARDAARAAAGVALGGFRRRITVEHKGANDLVTEYDRASEALLRERLAVLPIAIVGEEEGGTMPEDGVVLYVDPIDGTTNFVHGHPFWCVSIGLVVKGVPVLGVVVSPPLGIEWSGWVAESGERKATRSTAGVLEPCVPSVTTTLEDALFATGFPYDRRTSADDNLAAFCAIKKRCQAIRRCGSAAMDLCLVADGTYDGYWERKTRPWDMAGGAAIVRAAGGRVTDFTGGPDFIATARVVATNGAASGASGQRMGALHDALLAALAPHT